MSHRRTRRLRWIKQRQHLGRARPRGIRQSFPLELLCVRRLVGGHRYRRRGHRQSRRVAGHNASRGCRLNPARCSSGNAPNRPLLANRLWPSQSAWRCTPASRRCALANTTTRPTTARSTTSPSWPRERCSERCARRPAGEASPSSSALVTMPCSRCSGTRAAGSCACIANRASWTSSCRSLQRRSSVRCRAWDGAGVGEAAMAAARMRTPRLRPRRALPATVSAGALALAARGLPRRRRRTLGLEQSALQSAEGGRAVACRALRAHEPLRGPP